MANSRRKQSDICIVAHRGAQREAPENTRPAFDAALKYPIDGIEFDVQLSKDEVPVIYHDRTLARIQGGRKRVSDYSYQCLRDLDMGKWYSPKFSGESILTLEKMLRDYASKTQLFIEIKSRNVDRLSGRSMTLSQRVFEALTTQNARFGMKNIFILSYDLNVLNYPDFHENTWNLILNSDDPESIMRIKPRELNAISGLCIPIRKLTRDFVDFARQRNKQVAVFSCNVPRQVKIALECGAEIIMTDNPGWLTGNLDKFIQKSPITGGIRD